MFYRYRFKADIYPDLSRIPLHVRMKLDLTGLKISLKDWLGFSLEERRVLCHLPVDTDEEKQNFSSYLDFLSRRYFGADVAKISPAANPPWENLDGVPESVEAKSRETGQAITVEEWKRWNACQRYALFKLSASRNEPAAFPETLREFREEN